MKIYECIVAAQLESNQSGNTLVMVNDNYCGKEYSESYAYSLEVWKDKLFQPDVVTIMRITPSRASLENFDEAQKTLTDLYKFIQENYDGL